MKRDKYDAAFSELIRERADWTCERCGKQYHERRQGLHCSHFYSRANRAVRWDTLNAAAHCYSCHQHLGGNPSVFHYWIKEYLGPTLYELLNERRQRIRKWKQWEKDEMLAHYRAELNRLQDMRKQGITGYIEVVNYE